MADTRYKALLIGNARFDRDPHNLPILKGPPHDLQLLEKALTNPVTGLHRPEDVRTLLDGTNSEIREAIDDFFNDGFGDDQLLFYYSGHGWKDRSDALYLCARDTRIDRLASTAVSDTAINQMIASSHASRMLLILDCCHSGSFKGGGVPDTLLEASGRFVLTSTRSQELADDAGVQDGPSAFTDELVKAMLSGEVDTNHDGYITLTEVYQHILPKLKLSTKQIPQLHLDKTVGDLALSRSGGKKKVRRTVPEDQAGNPRLEVSDTKIELSDVRLGEKLPPVVIDVFNVGDGELSWTAETEDDWIVIEPSEKSFKLRLSPRDPGPHRGSVYVRDRGRGGSKRISVFAEVLEPTSLPVLTVAQTAIDFGALRVNGKAAPQVIALANKGTGELQARATTSNPRLRLMVTDEAVTIDPDLSVAGPLSGDVVISSAGGRSVVKVSGQVEPGPVLSVEPRRLDFGKVPAGSPQSAAIKISNSGTGLLSWSYQQNGDFFEVSQTGAPGELTVGLRSGQLGAHIGTLIIKSDGGEATVNVRAEVEAPPVLTPPPPPALELAGWWQNPNGRMFVTGHHPVYQYIDYNVYGAAVGNGTLTANGPQVTLQGAALMIPYTANLVINNPAMMSGFVFCMGAQSPVVYTRM